MCFVDDMLLRYCCYNRSIEDDYRYAIDAIIYCENAMCISNEVMSKMIELNARISKVDLIIYAIVDSSESNVNAKSNREIILRQQIFEPL